MILISHAKHTQLNLSEKNDCKYITIGLHYTIPPRPPLGEVVLFSRVPRWGYGFGLGLWRSGCGHGLT